MPDLQEKAGTAVLVLLFAVVVVIVCLPYYICFNKELLLLFPYLCLKALLFQSFNNLGGKVVIFSIPGSLLSSWSDICLWT